MSTAAQQNALMLASILGVGEAEAAERLERTVLITAEPGWKVAWARQIGELVGRTVQATFDPVAQADLELVIGTAVPRTAAKRLFADLDGARAHIGEEVAKVLATQPHPLYAVAAACAAAAAAIHTVIGDPTLPQVRLPLRLDYGQLGAPEDALHRPLVLDSAVMAGAGAVAHGFLWAARHIDLRGQLAIVDPKTVQAGVLNRCLYLVDNDIGQDKAVALAKRAQADFPALILSPRVEDFKAFVARLDRPPETVFVTVDSRHVRRSIQLEAPHRIIDASTTDVRGVVVHSNVLPSNEACLACIYRHVPEEHAREQSIAEGLGVDIADVRSGLITEGIAKRIALTHPQIEPAAIVNLAFDSLFRQLCSEQALATPEGRQVLAPFAFVSAWAGVLMVVETLRSFAATATTNYWSADPWNLPIARARMLRTRHPNCQFCSKPEYAPVIDALWGGPGGLV